MTSAVTSKVKVARSRDASDRCWLISREKNVLETPKLVRRLPTPRATFCLLVSKSNVTWSKTIHNITSFRTTITFYSHSLGGNTSTITLPPHFIVISYSLGGHTDNSNTAWVRTLWVHSSSTCIKRADTVKARPKRSLACRLQNVCCEWRQSLLTTVSKSGNHSSFNTAVK